MTGRPRIRARDKALAEGETRYKGSPCPGCGGTLRYTANYSCVTCDAERRRIMRRVYKPRGERAEALKRGDVYYMGPPCLRGHDGRRYSRSGHCVECVLRIYRIRKAIKEAPKYGLPKCRQKKPQTVEKAIPPEPPKMGWDESWGWFTDDPRAAARDYIKYIPRHPMVDAA